MKSLTFLALTLLISCGAAYGSPEIPSTFYLDESFPEDKVYLVKTAFDVWNSGIQATVFKFGGRIKQSYNYSDDINVIYWSNDIPKSETLGDAGHIFKKGGGLSDKIRCDVRIRASVFGGPIIVKPDEPITITPTLGNNVLVHVLVHELGHCIDLPHSINKYSIMYQYTDTSSKIYPALHDEDINLARKKLELEDE